MPSDVITITILLRIASPYLNFELNFLEQSQTIEIILNKQTAIQLSFSCVRAVILKSINVFHSHFPALCT